MILHFCHLSSSSVPFTSRGATLDVWYPLLFPELTWGKPEGTSPDTIVFIWNGSTLPRLDRFSDWYLSLKLPSLDGHKWITSPENLFRITRLENIEYLMTGEYHLSIPQEGCGSVSLFTPDVPLAYTSDPVDIDLAVRSFQYRYYTQKRVGIVDPASFYIDSLPEIGTNTRIHPGAVIEGDCIIGKNVTIGPNVHLINAQIGDGSVILTGSLIYDSKIGENTQIGPYAHLRAQTSIADNAKVGNFVEVKKSSVGIGSKAMHLSYLGDATIGRGVNIGAGTITCNYDGVNKNPTHIGDNVFVGSGTELVAPVTLEDNSFIAAGSTITDSVPSNSLAVARNRQRIIPDWAKKRRKQ